jgi:hypothetical protein
MTDADELLRQLLRRPPSEIESWLAAAGPPPDFNWRGLAEVAGWEALNDPIELTDALAWARIARLALDRLAAAAPGDRGEAQRSRNNLQRLRAGLITRHGVVPGDPFLDCDQLFDDFLARYGDQYDAVARDSERWTTLPIERIRDLRYIKNELNPLLRLDQCERFADAEVQRWVALWPQLP